MSRFILGTLLCSDETLLLMISSSFSTVAGEDKLLINRQLRLLKSQAVTEERVMYWILLDEISNKVLHTCQKQICSRYWVESILPRLTRAKEVPIEGDSYLHFFFVTFTVHIYNITVQISIFPIRCENGIVLLYWSEINLIYRHREWFPVSLYFDPHVTWLLPCHNIVSKHNRNFSCTVLIYSILFRNKLKPGKK